jgi:opacity protein-like surface antigen
VRRKLVFRSTALHAASGAAMLAVIASAPALAQRGMAGTDEHMVRVGFGGGVSVPVSDAKEAFKDGVNGTGFVLVHILGGLPALRFAFSYDRYKLKQAGGITPAAGEDEVGHSQILGGTAGIKLHLLPGPVRPFVMAGLGAFNVKDVIDAAGTSGSLTASKTNFGVDGGGGVEIKLGRLSAFAEAKIQNVYTKSGGVISRSSIQTVPVTFGLLF